MLLAQELIKLGEFDAALEQTKLVLDTDKDRPDAILLEARALAEIGSLRRGKGSLTAVGRRAPRVGDRGGSPPFLTLIMSWPKSSSSGAESRRRSRLSSAP